MWFTIGFTAACAAGIYLLLGSMLPIIAGAFVILSLILWITGKNWCRKTAVAILGCAVGALWLTGFDSIYLQPARVLDSTDISCHIRITDYSYETARGIAADGEVELDGKTYDVRVYLDEKETLRPGDCVDGSFTMRFTGFAGQKESTHHQGQGIFLLAYGDEYAVSYGLQESFWDFPATWRKNVTDHLDQLFSEESAPFARALLLGDTTKLDYKTDTDFSVSGIRHVVAVSGLHISILFSLIYLLGGGKRWLITIIGIPVLVLFAAVAGFTPSIVRACLMQILMIIAMLINREYDPPTALAFSVLTMLAVDPVTITSVSFQMSVGCMIGIFLFSGKISGYLLAPNRLGRWKGRTVKARLARWFAGSVSVSISAMVVTAPLSALYFETVSLIGTLTNLLTLWVISFIFYGIMAACLLGWIWMPLGQAVAWLIGWLIWFVRTVASLLASFPLAAVYTCSIYIVLWLCVCYVLFAAFLMCRRKRPWLLTGCAVFCLVISVAASWVEPQLDRFRITILDVGQGQSIILQHNDSCYLVDCGGDSGTQAADAAAQQLFSQGIFSLDGLILTHYDTDHAGGVLPLLSRMNVDTLYCPDIDPEHETRIQLEEAYGHKIHWISFDSQYRIDETSISLLTTHEKTSGNESSMCVLFQPENCDILITGDRGMSGERALVAQYQLPQLEVLLVGHHGGKNSTTLELLHETWPKMAIISVGVNGYGHPTEDVLERLERFGCQIMRTDLDGTIIIRG